MENTEGAIRKAEHFNGKSRPLLRTVLNCVLFLSIAAACLFIQCFSGSSIVSAQTDLRKSVSGERTLQVAQSGRTEDRGEFLREFSSGFSKGFDKNNTRSSGSSLIILLFLIVIIVFVSGLVYYDTVYLKQQADLENPWVVFKELCRAHQLNRSDKSFLRRAADKLDLDDPLPLFIEPKFLLSLLENRDFFDNRIIVMKLLYMFFGIEPPERYSALIADIRKPQ